MTILNDKQIHELCRAGVQRPMISPYVPALVREIYHQQHLEPPSVIRIISKGRSSYGYDIALSPYDFRVFSPPSDAIIDPKSPNPDWFVPAKLETDESGRFFIIPPYSNALGVALEYIDLPRNVTAVCQGKSTYARSFIYAQVTAVEAGWKGHLTLELTNPTNAAQKVYAGEGIMQLLFIKGEPCETSYEDRAGKYQSQPEKVVLGRV